VIRFARRYIQQSFRDTVQAFLDGYGWSDGSAVPSVGAITLQGRAPKAKDLEVVEENTAYVSFGDEPDHRPLELGGGLLRTERVFFVDVVATSEAAGEIVAGEIKDRLSGLFGGTRYLRPVDHEGRALPGYLVEFTDVALHKAEGERRNWFVVDGTLQIDFPGSDD